MEAVDRMKPGDANAWLAQAFALRKGADWASVHEAVDRALALEPRNLRALVLKADCLAHEGDARGASAFYRAAVQSSPPRHELPAETRSDVARAEAMCQRYAQAFETHLMERLDAAGFAPRASTARFAQALDLLFGRRQIFRQQPRFFYFPELPQIQFYDRSLFPWIERIEAAVPEIRAELLEMMRDGSAFAPYVEGDPRRPHKDQAGMRGNMSWSACYLVRDGRVVERNAALCARTLEALDEVPLAKVAGRSPSILFSQLRPGAHIPPHNGFVNTRLICHLPIIVPGQCRFRVGNEVREWVEGRAWLFDDTIEHEAWNRSDSTRVVLLFDVWRPELTEEERALVAAMFEAIDALGHGQPWEA